MSHILNFEDFLNESKLNEGFSLSSKVIELLTQVIPGLSNNKMGELTAFLKKPYAFGKPMSEDDLIKILNSINGASIKDLTKFIEDLKNMDLNKFHMKSTEFVDNLTYNDYELDSYNYEFLMDFLEVLIGSTK
jgi:hypothetical protein